MPPLFPAHQVINRLLRGRYRIKEEKGRGGLGVVFRAEDEHLMRRFVAAKFLYPQWKAASSAERRIRFSRETLGMSNISSPHVVDIIGFGDEELGGERLAYYVMEYIESNLWVELYASRPSSMRLAGIMNIFRQMLLGTMAIHDSGRVHRNLRPRNVLLTRTKGNEPFVKVGDLGYCHLNRQRPVTQTGGGVGDLLYASPEQLAQSRNVTPRSDVYSLGIILHEMLTRCRLDGARARARSGTEGSQAELDAHRQIEGLVSRMVDPNPAHRFESGGAVLDVVNEVQRALARSRKLDGDVRSR